MNTTQISHLVIASLAIIAMAVLQALGHGNADLFAMFGAAAGFGARGIAGGNTK